MNTITLEQKWDEKYTLVSYDTNYGLFEDNTLLYMVELKKVEDAVKTGYFKLYGANLKITKIE